MPRKEEQIEKPLGHDKPGWRRLSPMRRKQGPRQATADREAMQTTLARAEMTLAGGVVVAAAAVAGIEQGDQQQ